MSNQTFAEPCAFRILGLNVTEDAALIARTFEEKKKANKAWEQSTRPNLRQNWKDLFTAGTDLADPATHKALVQSHCSDFQKLVEGFCGAIPPGTPLPPDNRRKIEEQGVKVYHLAPELAARVTGEVLRHLGIQERLPPGQTPPPPRPSSPPALVTGLKIAVDNGIPRLSWSCPAAGCERVRVVAQAGGFPRSDSDGRDVFDGLDGTCLDLKAVPGELTYYAVYSYSDGQSTAPKSTQASYILTAGISGLTSETDVGRIGLKWNNPPGAFRRIVVFRSISGGPGVTINADGIPSAGKGVLEIPVNKEHTLAQQADDGIIPGKTYEYTVFVDWGTHGGQSRYSVGQSITASAVPAANPVKDAGAASEFDGNRLTWKHPGDRCDKVTVVRSKGATFPAAPADGIEITDRSGSGCLDRGLTAGLEYCYSIFSTFQGRASARVDLKCCFAGPPTDLKVADPKQKPGCNSLRWSVPPKVVEARVWRRRGGKPEVRISGGAPLAAAGEQVALPSGAAGAVDDPVPPGVEFHYCVFFRYADGQWSAPAFVRGTALEPPRSVDGLSAVPAAEGFVDLRWTPLTNMVTAGIDYQVWRRSLTGSRPGAEAQVKTSPLVRTEVSVVCQDRGVTPGVTYEYAVKSIVGPLSAMSAWVPRLVTKSVTAPRAVGTNGGARLEWDPPAGVAGVRVERQGGGGVSVGAGMNMALDSGLVNGTRYRYTITAVFRDLSGGSVAAPGVGIDVVPVCPPQSVADLRVAYKQGAPVVEWAPPAEMPEAIWVYRFGAPPPYPKDHVLPLPGQDGRVSRLDGGAKSFRDVGADFERTVCYAVYTVRGQTATYCGAVTASLYPPVGNLTAKNLDGEVALEWSWPAGISVVKIRRRGGLSGAAGEWSCTRQMYESNGHHWRDREVAKGPAMRIVYVVQCVSPVGGGESLVSTQVEIWGGKLPSIECELKRRKPATIRCKLPVPWPKPCGLVLVRDEMGFPTSSRDPVARLTPAQAKGQPHVDLVDTKGRGRRYYRVFAEGTDSPECPVVVKYSDHFVDDTG